jgi:hypothetical protein
VQAAPQPGESALWHAMKARLPRWPPASRNTSCTASAATGLLCLSHNVCRCPFQLQRAAVGCLQSSSGAYTGFDNCREGEDQVMQAQYTQAAFISTASQPITRLPAFQFLYHHPALHIMCTVRFTTPSTFIVINARQPSQKTH